MIRIPSSGTQVGMSVSSAFDIVNIDGLTVSNVTQYQPGLSNPLIMSIDTTTTDVTINNLAISNVDLVLSPMSAIKVANYGKFTLNNATISDINKIAYDLNSQTYAYVSTVGAVFYFENLVSNNTYGNLTYSMTNVTFDNVYSKKGGAIYIAGASGVTNFQSTTLNLNQITVKNGNSFQYGMLTVETGLYNVAISNSNFESNSGYNGEADMRVLQASSFTVTSTTFSLFSSTNSAQGSSTTVITPSSVDFTLLFTSVTLQCSDAQYTDTLYKTYLSQASAVLTKASPIFISSGKLQTTSCEFSGWATANSGGVLKLSTSSVSHKVIQNSNLKEEYL